jgi:hypothetical protein
MEQNEILNNVLIVLGRSLLQYMEEAWPWTHGGNSDHRRAVLNELIDRQRADIQKLSDLLDARRCAVDFGAFPDFTDLHYLSLEFVLPHLIENEQAVIREIEAAKTQCASDFEGAALLDEILPGQMSILARLKELGRSASAVPAR